MMPKGMPFFRRDLDQPPDVVAQPVEEKNVYPLFVEYVPARSLTMTSE